jgi:hypothetical protein
MTDLWFRNPMPYLPELKEVMSEFKIVWDIAFLNHYNFNAYTVMRRNFGDSADWQFMVIYGLERYAELRNNKNELLGKFPMWSAEEDSPDLLMDYIDEPDFVKDSVPGQPHKIIIADLDVHLRKQQIYELSEVQKAHPEVQFHIYNTFSFQAVFGMEFYGGDLHPRDAAALGKIVLPSGKSVTYENFGDAKIWIESLGFKPEELKTNRKLRIKYNIVSASWAAEHYTELPIFKNKINYIPLSSAVGKEVMKRNTPLTRTGLAIQEGDKKACDFCTLWNSCRYFREGSVCMMPESDYKEIANLLGTRDAFSIATGISRLLAVNVDRIEGARDIEERRMKAFIDAEDDNEEDEEGKRKSRKIHSALDPELTKLVDSTIKHGVALANLFKLPDANGRIVVQVLGGAAGGTSGALSIAANPAASRELASRAVAEIEASGISREDITEEMVTKWLIENIVEGEAEPA